jgi:hypothetical protein
LRLNKKLDGKRKILKFLKCYIFFELNSKKKSQRKIYKNYFFFYFTYSFGAPSVPAFFMSIILEIFSRSSDFFSGVVFENSKTPRIYFSNHLQSETLPGVGREEWRRGRGGRRRERKERTESRERKEKQGEDREEEEQKENSLVHYQVFQNG